uniref:AMP-dependent synthetase and ligase n=1 Tax=Marinomonas sp. (strain MWYL1) TaxID=400668 RepID=A6VVT2_MARMS
MKEAECELAECGCNNETMMEDYLYRIQRNLFVDCSNKSALVFDKEHISYRDLGVNVAKMIGAFKQEGLVAGSVVAICLRKSPEYIYTVLACALTGVIWLPIDVDSPLARQNYLLSNSHADRRVSDGDAVLESTLNVRSILEEDYEPEIGEGCFEYKLDNSPAYYLYTSGSTGTPKCVVLNNQATANVLQQTIERWHISASDTFMAVTPFHHDMSVFDIFAAISVGATLVIPTFEQQKNALDWAKLVAENRITIWVSVPAIVDMLFTVAKKEQLLSLRLIAQGGDYIKPSLISRIRMQLPDVVLFSLGGPTETTIWSIWHEISELDQEAIPYGKPLLNNQYFILNEQHQACSVGEVGRMYMSGMNLSNGYLLDGKIIPKDFIQIQTSENKIETVFQMSDLGYLREDQTIIFAGREEGYLKVQGVRIAAAEVENAMSQHPQVHDAVVVCCTHPEADVIELVAIYTQEFKALDKPLEFVNLRGYLQDYLPSSHIPTRGLLVEALPLTANGKIDRKALLKTAQQQLYHRLSYSPSSQSKDLKGLRNEGINELVFEVFEHVVKDHGVQTISASTQLSSFNIRPKQLMVIAKYLTERGGVEIDFYALARCRTVGEVIRLMQGSINAA